MSEHKNPRFNIVQASGPTKMRWVVIRGQRTASGNKAFGAVVLTQPMSREGAIALADQYEREFEKEVYVALHNALTYGYDELLDWSDEQIADDLIECGSWFEFCEPSELIPYVTKWRANLPPR